MSEIVLISQDRALIAACSSRPIASCYRVLVFTGVAEAHRSHATGCPVVLVCDCECAGILGVADLLREAHGLFPESVLLAVKAAADADASPPHLDGVDVELAWKPMTPAGFAATIDRCVSERRQRAELAYYRRRDRVGVDALLGASPAVRSVRSLLDQLAGLCRQDGSGPTVMLRGERGTGKRLAARILHNASARLGRPFIELDCAGTEPDGLEQELFGGPAIGGGSPGPGAFDMAVGGTVFLREVSALPLTIQSRLLRILDGEPRGAVGTTVMASSRIDLEEPVGEGRFLRELQHGLGTVTVELPPLRSCEGDALLLASSIGRELASRCGLPEPVFGTDAAMRLNAHTWPGNVHELRSVVEAALARTRGGRVTAADLLIEPPRPDGAGLRLSGGGAVVVDFSNGPIPLSEVEAVLIREALDFSRGNQVRSARLLGISRHKLRYRLAKTMPPRESAD